MESQELRKAGLRVETDLRAHGVAVLDVAYGERVELRLGAAPDDVERLHGILAGLTAGAAALTRVGERWVHQG